MVDVKAAQHILDTSPFGPWWGFRVVTVSPGHAELRLPARAELFRPGGILQGGCAMTLADVAFWIAVITRIGPDEPAVTLGQTSTFLHAARTDLVCTADLRKSGRSLLYGTAEVFDAAGTLVAHHTLTYLRTGHVAASGRDRRPIVTS
ncbi:MAG TPA: PaaI family thioesterase [Pseudonocardia sp.]|jgi:uncharacterized protein (TIGR00369 family)|nr:PaaI family thioesterase [Pseudonocardia sp.]